MRYKAILFDLDGTLVDTLADLTEAMNYALRQLGLPVHTAQACREMVGFGNHEFARRALPAGREDLADLLRNQMIEYYDLHCLDKTRPYEGFEEILPVLKSKGTLMAVVSNKNHLQTVKIAEHYFGRETFDFICGMSDSHRAKPDPDMALAALKTLAVPAAETIFLGDSDIDIQTARAAGIEPVGAAWGFRSPEVLRKAGAEKILIQPEEILKIL
ncbi:MAG TPA: HAD-IA family hydrolase [Anaerohalosphaeraceae bacterium]|jgi:phosphoglycolate phosphatase|nr:HAD-IA family hydrolase [Anaerohalosphaeraceae bacterium]